MKSLRTQVLSLIRILRLTLSEIFDEAAYARYLERAGVAASRQSYARFFKEKQQARSPAARCC